MSVELQAFLQLVITAFITAVVPIIAYKVTVILDVYAKNIWNSLDSDQRAEFSAVMTIFVKSAEKSGLTKQILNTGLAKKDYVLDLAQTWLDSKGITTISVAEIKAVLESKIIDGVHKGEPTWFVGAGKLIGGEAPADQAPAAFQDADNAKFTLPTVQ